MVCHIIPVIEVIYIHPPGNQHIPSQGTFEDDFPFPKVKYGFVRRVSSHDSSRFDHEALGGMWDFQLESSAHSTPVTDLNDSQPLRIINSTNLTDSLKKIM